MSDFLTSDTKATILLCGFFGNDRAIKPLTQTEYTRLVSWLISAGKRPADLLQADIAAEAAHGSRIEKQHLASLLNRGAQLGFAIEEWQRIGIWIISRSDPQYPTCFKKHLREKAPPLLFGVGNPALLVKGGLGIVGSRNVDQTGEMFTREAAQLCAFNKMPVVSGCARGVDQIGMTTTLEAGGVTVGILAENLLKKSLERSNRKAIAQGRLLLCSPYHPKARFSVGTAMARNKLIYALADFTLVVSAEYKKGGTWAGASEELKRSNARPVFVRTSDQAPPGNRRLLEFGALTWPQEPSRADLGQQLFDASKSRADGGTENLNLFDAQTIQVATALNHSQKRRNLGDLITPVPGPTANKEITPGTITSGTVYQAVLPMILNKLEKPTTSDDLARRLDVVKTQLNVWLKRAVADDKIVKLSHPVRYKTKLPHAPQ